MNSPHGRWRTNLDKVKRNIFSFKCDDLPEANRCLGIGGMGCINPNTPLLQHPHSRI